MSSLVHDLILRPVCCNALLHCPLFLLMITADALKLHLLDADFVLALLLLTKTALGCDKWSVFLAK